MSEVAASRRKSHGRRPWVLAMFSTLLAVAFVGFVSLGVWQVQRMGWKRDLIARVDARVHAAPVPAPARAQWPAITEVSDGYRHVSVAGRFMPGMESRAQAVTELGAGYWSLVPLRTDPGDIVLINRGFVPVVGKAGVDANAANSAVPPPQGRVIVNGLLRVSEPGGGFLRHNDPARQRWYSRDVAAIAQSHGLPADRVAPFFIDADRTSAAPLWPRAGMTVVKFRDSHLSYAVTWFGLALLTLVGAWFLFASERRVRDDRRP